MNEYVYKRLTKESIVDLNWLFMASSKTSTNLSYFQKKYNTDYSGVSYTGYLAFDENNKPAAFYGVIPTVALINNKPVRIAQSADTLTHPGHQRKGLFTKLALMTYELAKEEGIHFLFGIPNENSFPGFINKLNWTQNGNLQKFEFKVPMLPFSQLFRKNRVLNSIYQLWVDFILLFVRKEHDSFPNPNIIDNNIGIYRNNDYFTYKKYSKKHIVNILGKKVWLKFDGTLKIGEIESHGNNDLKKIILRLKIIALLTGIQKIQYQCSPESACLPFFSAITACSDALPIIYLNLTGEFSPEKFVLSLADFDTF